MRRNIIFQYMYILFSAIFLFLFNVSAQVPSADSLALVALYDSTGGDNWTNNMNWKSSAPVSDWYGVYVLNGRVREIHLVQNNLNGTLPPKLGDLTALSSLSLQSNDLSGKIPPSIENLTELDRLDLYNNHFSEHDIPPNFANLRALTFLNLSNNQFSDIPISIINLPTLKDLYMGYNTISNVPAAIADMDSLQTLFLNGNNLQGVFTPEIASLTHLTALYLAANNFTEIPADLLSMTWLKSLDMSSNQLDENDLADLGVFVNLEDLFLVNMELSYIPSSITSLSGLKELQLYYNQINDAGLGDLGNLTQLRILSLAGNALTHFPDQVFNMPDLYYLALYDNDISGPIPPEISQLNNLNYLYIGNNHFSGAVPEGITSLTNLYYLDISYNELTDLPDLRSMTTLYNVTVEHNRFTFEDIEPNIDNPPFSFNYIPQKDIGVPLDTAMTLGQNITLSVTVGGSSNHYQWFKDNEPIAGATDTALQVFLNAESDFGQYRLKATSSIVTDLELWSAPFNIVNPHYEEQDSLALVSIYNNMNGANWSHKDNWLNGPVSTWFGVTKNAGRVIYLDLPKNNLSGDIPPAIGDLTGLIRLDMSQNSGLSGNLPAEIGNLTNLQNAYLNGCNISVLPSTIGSLVNLVFLELSDNNLRDLPNTFADLSSLKDLRLNSNNFTQIPPPVLQLSALYSLNFGSNKITNIPAQIANLNALQFLNMENNPIADNIAPELGGMTNLTNLFLNDTQMTTLPEFITNMTQLNRLSIGNNNLTLEDLVNLGNLVNLTSLDIRGLGLNMFPSGFTNLKALRSLWLEDNNLTQNELYLLNNFTELQILSVSNNKLTAFPSSLWSLNNLFYLIMDHNSISGNIPVDVGNLTALEIINFSNNDLSGAVPQQITNLGQLYSLNLSYNHLSDLPDLSPLSQLNYLWINNNSFSFEDIEPNINVPKYSFFYAPQDSVGQEETRVVAPGSPTTLSVDVGGQNNLYTWYKNGNQINGATESSLTIQNADFSDEGTYECRISNSVVSDLTLYSRPITLEVKGKPFIVMGGVDQITPKTATITAQIVSNGFPTNAFIDYGTSAAYGYSVPAQENPITGQGAISIAVQLFGLNEGTSYHYRIRAVNDSGSVNSDDRTFETVAYPAVITLSEQIELPSHPDKSDYKTTDYRMAGIPGMPDAMIADFVSGSENEDWTIYWDNGEPENYLIKFDGSEAFRCDVGKGFWVLSKDGMNINTDVNTAPLNGHGQTAINLHPGWNIITCPFTTPVKWSVIKEVNSLGAQQLFAFAGSYATADYLRPYKAYYFNAPEGFTTLIIPFPTGAGTQLAKKELKQDFEWRVGVSLQSEGFTDETTSFGVLSDSASQDAVDYNFLKPHAMDDILNIYFYQPGPETKQACWAWDIREKGREIYHWQIAANVFPNKKAHIRFEGLDDIPATTEIYLIDRARAATQNLRSQASYSFTSSGSNYHLEIIAGKKELVHQELAKVLPKTYHLGTNYPNPFNPQTTIPVALPKESTIDLSIYDVLGKKVATIYSGKKEAGRHLFSFNIQSVAGRQLGSGVYFYRLVVQGQAVVTKKMMLLK